MLTDLIAATPEEAEAILHTQGHANVWPTLDAKTVDQVKLASLAFILKGKVPKDDAVIDYMKTFKNLLTASDDGPWIDLVSMDLRDSLANLPEDQVEIVAKSWAATEEAKLDRWNPNDVAHFLRQLSAFAASARAEKRSLLLWACL